MFTTLSYHAISWNSADFPSIIVIYTIVMFMMSSIVFQHAVKMLLGPPVGVCRVPVCVSLLAMEAFLEETVHTLFFFPVEFLCLTEFRQSLFF